MKQHLRFVGQLLSEEQKLSGSSGHSAGASKSGHLPGLGDGVDVANLSLNVSQTGTS